MIDSSGKRIRGKIDPFTKELDALLFAANTNNGFEIFREYLKDAVALRMQHTLYTPIFITDNCIKIIKNYKKETHICSFIQCAIRYYCNKKTHKITSLDFSSSCASKDYHKSLQHAKQDCLACVYHYTNKIKRSNANSVMIEKKCRAIENAVEFFCDYIYSLYEGKLPKTIKKTTYDAIHISDSSISDVYAYNELGEYYELVDKKKMYQSVSIETATELFCSCYRA